MRTYRCYHPESISPDQDLILTPEASHHLAIVLRAKIGNPIEVFDCDGHAYSGELLHVAKRITVRLRQPLTDPVESPLYIHLLQAIGKNDKIDWVLQKAVELGVSEITLLLTERTEVRIPEDQWLKKLAHWNGVVINAVEQSGRVKVPRLHPPIKFSLCIGKPVGAEVKLMMQVGAQSRLSDVLPSHFSDVAILIGPEGGFSEREGQEAQAQGYQLITLGPRVMRTETAPLAIISALQLLHGDF